MSTKQSEVKTELTELECRKMLSEAMSASTSAGVTASASMKDEIVCTQLVSVAAPGVCDQTGQVLSMVSSDKDLNKVIIEAIREAGYTVTERKAAIITVAREDADAES